MTADEIERFRRVEAIFDAVLEYPPGPERDAFLLQQEAVAGLPLIAEVRQLLEGHEAVTAAVPMPPDALPRFGPWQAVRVLGRGGMGEVYLAERADGAFQMKAAVKVAPLALASPDIEERFRRERQFLASLDHPKVARLIDGGFAGLPYLVMEFVDGVSIDRYCDAVALDARGRVALMRQVLEALIYVHGCGVIHRDLKPSNILVDAAGNAKLLDFGTARLVDATGDSIITRIGVFAFTPDFASPEQTLAKPLTVATDIYSAGALFYRLLTGRPPYRFTDYSPGAVAQTIGHGEPEPSGLDRRLDAILSKALRKNPEERYASAAEMDADLARYLEGQPVRARRSRKLAPLAIVAAVVALSAAAIIGWRFAVRTAASQTSATLAVLPFTNLSADPADQYFSDGLTDEVRDSLARLKALRVIARSSTSLFKKEPRNLRDIGRQLHVSHLLEASVERSGDRVNIVASLVRTSDGARIWTNTYRRQAADLGAIQADLAEGVGSSLGIDASAAVKKYVPPSEAHDLYLKARFEAFQATVKANTQAEEDFRRAIQIDPNYALPYAGLASAIWNQNIFASQSPLLEERRKAEELWQKALEIDSGLEAAHSGLATYAMQYDWDWNRAEREFQAALANGENSSTESNYAVLCIIRGRRAEADRHRQRANDLDPIGARNVSSNAQFLVLEDRLAEATEEYRKMVSRTNGLNAKLLLNSTLAQQGQTDVAIRNLLALPQELPSVQMGLAQAKAMAGAGEEARGILAPLERKYRDSRLFMYDFAVVYAAMGDESSTITWLGRSLDAREGPAIYIPVDPVFAKMQHRPAFRALKKRMDLDW